MADRSLIVLSRLVVGGALLGACTASPAAAPTTTVPRTTATSPAATPVATTETTSEAPPVASTETPAATPVATEAPTTTPEATTSASSAGRSDGPDPDGRIAFGRITRMDDVYGQVVALYAIDPDGTDLVQLTDGESAFPEWSRDGSRLAFTQGQPDGSWQIATMAADGSDMRVLTSGTGISEVPSWSPNGTWLVYDHSPSLPGDGEFHTSIYRIDADGSDAELIGDPETFDVEPRVSPDGTRMVFARLTDEGSRSTLVVRDIESGDELVVKAAGDAVEHPTWSPDGQWILYNIASWVTGDAADEQMERVAADGSGDPIVVWDPSPDEGVAKPWYSPDGTRILTSCILGTSDDALCMMNADGSNVEIFIDEPGVHDNHPTWGAAPSV